MEHRKDRTAFCGAGIMLACCTPLRGQIIAPPASCSVFPGCERTVAAAGPEEEQSHPDYGGALAERGYLSGDWGGRRSTLADAGLTLDLGLTQVAQGVVRGGRRRDWDFSGNADALLTADLKRLGLGGTLVVRAESRFGETVNDDAGSFTPVNTRGYFPLTDRLNQGIPFAITELTYALEVLPTLEVTLGKMITADGDPTEFAGGRGRTQFLNSNFIYNQATSQTSPYSTLGAALDWSPAGWITVSSAVLATRDSSTTTAVDHLDNGWTWWMQVATQYRLGTLPGGMNIGAQYAFDGEFTRIGGSLASIPAGGGLETVGDSWALFWGGWQYLYTAEPAPAAVDASDDHADVRGVGLFARYGLADPDANAIDWSASIGVGGRGMIAGREKDSFGFAYFYTAGQDTRGMQLIGFPSSVQGVEAYYCVALTPAAALTLDVQWVDGGLPGTSPATVLGARLSLTF